MSKLSKKINLQLYTVRDQTGSDFDGTIKKVAEMGYDGVELTGLGGHTAIDLKKMLDDLNLTPVGIHIGMDALANNFDQIIADHRILGNDMLTIPHLTIKSIEDAQKAASSMNELGKRCKANGFKLSYHNHDFEFRNYDGRKPFDVMLAETDPSCVYFQMDTCWVQVGGFDPVEYIDKYPGRFLALHIKDYKNVDGKTVQTEVGTGSMDFPAIIAAARKTDVKDLIIEQDTCILPSLESVKISLDNLRKML